MTVKDGFGNKPTHIRVSGRSHDYHAMELWIEQTGQEGRNETLAYMTLLEALQLRDELNEAIKWTTHL